MRALWLVALLIASGCGTSGPNSPTNPDAPKDPGTIVVFVHDDAGAPLAGVHVEVTEPNNVGSFFQFGLDTDSTGKLTFLFVPAGQRPVKVFPPSGYRASADGPIQNADVIKSQTTTVTFTLIRDAPAFARDTLGVLDYREKYGAAALVAPNYWTLRGLPEPADGR